HLFKITVVESMAANLVAAPGNHGGQTVVLLDNMAPDQEKGGMHAIPVKHIEVQGRELLRGAVVECDGGHFAGRGPVVDNSRGASRRIHRTRAALRRHPSLGTRRGAVIVGYKSRQAYKNHCYQA